MSDVSSSYSKKNYVINNYSNPKRPWVKYMSLFCVPTPYVAGNLCTAICQKGSKQHLTLTVNKVCLSEGISQPANHLSSQLAGHSSAGSTWML